MKGDRRPCSRCSGFSARGVHRGAIGVRRPWLTGARTDAAEGGPNRRRERLLGAQAELVQSLAGWWETIESRSVLDIVIPEGVRKGSSSPTGPLEGRTLVNRLGVRV